MKSNAAVAVLTCRPNSHPFQDRTISVTEPIKIGRSVARARPTASNVIFDCKVLSRNHALLWYENDQFYLQDTKSSNGTFVNNQRLSKGSEESAPREIFSGDIVQFGVDVMENSRRVTHNCIIAAVQLFHADGTECRPMHPAVGSPAQHSLQSHEVYQLAQCIQEALHRERILETKLSALQSLVQTTQDSSEESWQALIDEERLLSRVEVLEAQLQSTHKGQTDESLRLEVVALQKDKHVFESTSKESLRKALQEKLDAINRLEELERALTNTEEELKHQRNMAETSRSELLELAKKHDETSTDLAEVQQKLAEEERRRVEDDSTAEMNKSELETRIMGLLEAETSLTASNEALRAENDMTKEQLISIRAKLDTINEQTGVRIPDTGSKSVQVDMVTRLELEDSRRIANADSDNEDEKEDDDVADEDSDNTMLDSEFTLRRHPKQLGHVTMGKELICREKGQTESEGRDADMNIVNKLRSELDETSKQLQLSREQVVDLAAQLKSKTQQVTSLMTELSRSREQLLREKAERQDVFSVKQETVQQLEDRLEKMTSQLDEEKTRCSKLEQEGLRLRTDLRSSSTIIQSAANESAANKEMTSLREECAQLRMRVMDIESEIRNSRQENQLLKMNYNKLQLSYRQLEELKERLEQGQIGGGENRTDAQKETEQLRSELERERVEVEQLRMRIRDSQTEITELRNALHEKTTEYSDLDFQTGILFKVSLAPFILIAFAFVMAFYPALSSFTATSSP